MIRFLYICLVWTLCLSQAALAGEDYAPAAGTAEINALAGQLNQGPAAGTTPLMSAEDMAFDDGAADAFTVEPDSDILPVIPMIQKNRPGFDAVPQASRPASQNNTVASAAGSNADKAVSAPQPIAGTLTDTLQKQDKESLSPLPLPDVSGTWVDKLAGSVPLSIGNGETVAEDGMPQLSGDDSANASLRSLVDGSKQSDKRSNASVFDISGIMLRMTLSQADKAMMTRGFKKISQSYEIPNFIKWRNEEKCRGAGVVGYERLMNCVVKMAKSANHQYVDTVKYSKFSTKEEIEIKLTSNFTNNKVYRIIYKSMSGKVVGSGAKAAYLRNIKVFDFWKKVNQKYGTPDNKDEVTWGLGGNKPYLKASTGFLVLEDPMLRELDYTRMSREDQRFMNTDLYSF